MLVSYTLKSYLKSQWRISKCLVKKLTKNCLQGSDLVYIWKLSKAVTLIRKSNAINVKVHKIIDFREMRNILNTRNGKHMFSKSKKLISAGPFLIFMWGRVSPRHEYIVLQEIHIQWYQGSLGQPLGHARELINSQKQQKHFLMCCCQNSYSTAL